MRNKLGKYLYWLIAVFPFILSAAFYSRLPERMAVHWDAVGNPNNYASRTFAAFELPALLLIVTLFVNFSISADPQKQNIDRSPQLKFIVRWFIVILANIAQGAMIFKAMNYNFNISVLLLALVGLLIAVIGNYLPKCKYNYTMGIKLPWTLASEENWRKTHRFAGFVWIIAGILMIVSAFVPSTGLILGITLLMVAVPAVYSYLIFLKEREYK
jgi:uncharacterized membrane protein